MVPTGATGFRHHKAAPLPETDPRAIARLSHELARNLGGTVEQIIPPSPTSTFYSVMLAHGHHDARRVTVLFHRHLPLLALVAHPPRGLDDLSIIDDPVASAAMPDHTGFQLLTPGQLAAPVTRADLSQLAAPELDQIASWKPKTIGEVLFNLWDLPPVAGTAADDLLASDPSQANHTAGTAHDSTTPAGLGTGPHNDDALPQDRRTELRGGDP